MRRSRRSTYVAVHGIGIGPPGRSPGTAAAALARGEACARRGLEQDEAFARLAWAEEARRGGVGIEADSDAVALADFGAGLAARARLRSGVREARAVALRRRLRAARGTGKPPPAPGPAGGWPVPPSVPPDSVTTQAAHERACRRLDRFVQDRTASLRRLADAAAANGAAAVLEDVPNEMYVALSAALDARVRLLCQPWSGRRGAAAAARAVVWHLCRGCRQQRAALAAGREAVSGHDPAGLLGTGFDLPDLPELAPSFVLTTVATSAPFLALAPTADLLAQVVNFAQVTGVAGPRSAGLADPLATDADRAMAVRLLQSAVGPVAEIHAQLGVFIGDGPGPDGPVRASGALRLVAPVPVGWPRPVVDPAAAPGLAWVVPADRRWRLDRGWHVGTGLPPTLDVLAAVVPPDAPTLASLAQLRTVSAAFVRCAVHSDDTDHVFAALLATEALGGTPAARARLWMPGIELAVQDARGVPR